MTTFNQDNDLRFDKYETYNNGVLSLLFIISGNLSMVKEYKRDPLMGKWVTQELLLINQNSFSLAFCCKWSKGKRLIDSFFTFFSIVVIITHKVFFLVCSFCMTYLHNTSHVSCASRNIFCELVWVHNLSFQLENWHGLKFHD